jgi:hypothetical protein
MKAAVRLFVVGLVACWSTGCLPGEHKAQLTVRVTDDEGKPVADAMVAVLGFNRERKGKTDRDGRFTATLRNGMSGVDIVAEKKGYYSIGRYIYEFTGGYTNDQWRPWNPELNLMLAKKRTPAVLQQKYVHGAGIPFKGEPAGYDLLVGDWVAPAGKGQVSDFIFLAHTTTTNGNSTSNRLALTFSNPADGLIHTNIHWRNDYTLRLPPIAPQTGYSNKWEFYLNESRDPVTRIIHRQVNWSEDDNYYFRVRSRLDANGLMRSAIYGKIYQGILYGPARESNDLPSITFHYYYNPDGTRNLESKGERPDIDP